MGLLCTHGANLLVSSQLKSLRCTPATRLRLPRSPPHQDDLICPATRWPRHMTSQPRRRQPSLSQLPGQAPFALRYFLHHSNLVGPAGPARISVSLAGHGAAAATTAPAATGAAYFPLLCRRVSAAAAALPAPGKAAAKSGVLHYSPLAASHVLRLRRCRPRDFVTPFILPVAGAESAALPCRPPRLLPSPPPAAPSL